MFDEENFVLLKMWNICPLFNVKNPNSYPIKENMYEVEEWPAELAA